MNFKTTIVLVALLAVAGVALLLTREKGGEESEKAVESQQKVLDIQPGDVNGLLVTSSEGKMLALERSGGTWRVSEPVAAAAESFEVDDLLRSVTGMESSSIVSGASATGLDKPRFTIDLTTTDGKSYTVLVGDKTAVGDSLYVSRKDKGETFVVAADLLEKLNKPASDYRDPKLVNMSSGEVTQVTIQKPDGKLVLAKAGGDWKITEPTPMPAEKSDVDDILFGLTGLRATEVVAEDTKEAASYQLEPARFTATLTAAPTTLPTGIAAATAPSTAPAIQPATVTIKLGGYDDVLKKNVLVTTSHAPVIAKVGATIIETINKKPLDIRDRRVLDIESANVASITIASDLVATTRPTSRPASKTTVTLKRRHEAVAQGPALPATKPATRPATTIASTTQASTAPATAVSTTQAATQPVTKWQVAAAGELKDADDAKVGTLLSHLHPLRAQKYLESTPATQPAATYVVTVTTQAAGGAPATTHELRLVDPGDSKPLIGTYNGLAFEVDRFIADRLAGDFLKGSAPAGGSDDEAPIDTPGSEFQP